MKISPLILVVPVMAFGVTIEPLPQSEYRKLDEAWNLVKVTRRGVGEVCELTTVEGAKPGAALIIW